MMQTRAQLSETYDTADSDILDRIEAIQAAGKRHGAQGWYRDSDFCSDADWCNGVGAELIALESETGIDAFETYTDAHAEALHAKPSILLTSRDLGVSMTDAEFRTFVAYVRENIAGRCGFEVHVEPLASRYTATCLCGTDEQETAMDKALNALIDSWCAAGATDG